MSNTGPDPARAESTPAPAAATTTAPQGDWTDQVTDLIVDLVDQVHDKTTGPVLQGARALVYGAVAVIVAIFVMVSLVILSVRGLTLLVGEVWISYLAIGGLLTVVGTVLWLKRRTAHLPTE